MNRYRTVRSFRKPSSSGSTDELMTQDAQTDLVSSLFVQPETEARKPEPASADTTDVCPYLFDRCKEWQKQFMDAAGLTCMFDVDSGRLKESVCEILAKLVHNRMRNLADTAEGPGGTITLTLRHRGSLWALAIADQFVRHRGPRLQRLELQTMRDLAGRLEGAYVIQAIDDGSLVAILFSETPGVLSPAALAENRQQFRQ